MTACRACDDTGRVRVGRVLGVDVWGDCPDHRTAPTPPPPARCRWPRKVAYATDADAAAHRRDLIRGGGSRASLRIYRCPAGHWHVGNTDRWAKLNERIPPRRGRSRR